MFIFLFFKSRAYTWSLRLGSDFSNNFYKTRKLTQFCDATDGAPVELDRAADSVDTGSDDHDLTVASLEGDVVLAAVVGQVEIVRRGGPLGGDGINLKFGLNFKTWKIVENVKLQYNRTIQLLVFYNFKHPVAWLASSKWNDLFKKTLKKLKKTFPI
jgi:hypothetical protein